MKSGSDEPPSRLTVDLINRSNEDLNLQPLQRCLRLTLFEHGMSAGEISVLLTTNDEVRSLNRQFRSLDESTDVLTFPATTNPICHLGDIIIAVPFAALQARKRGVTLDIELAYLAIHGALHLAGFDDETTRDHKAMQAEMARIAKIAGLPSDPDWSSLDVRASAGHSQ